MAAFFELSSRKIAKNKMKQPKDITFKLEENSSNLERTNQCWYIPRNENNKNQ